MLDRQQSVADLVLDHSECARIFKRHGIDFCCRGELSIEAAAKARGVDLDALMQELSRAVGERSPQTKDLRELATPELVAYIVDKHHGYLREALPFIRGLAAKVRRVHGEHNPKLRDLTHVHLEHHVLVPRFTAA